MPDWRDVICWLLRSRNLFSLALARYILLFVPLPQFLQLDSIIGDESSLLW
jgi:hypothetical protein